MLITETLRHRDKETHGDRDTEAQRNGQRDTMTYCLHASVRATTWVSYCG